MSIFAIADLHLSNFPGSEKPMDVFGDRWFNHQERIRENWCERVTEYDTVVVAGDISWGLKLQEAEYDLRWIDELPGKKVIIKGNHDLWWSGINKLNSMFDSITFLQNDACEAEDTWICGARGWITPSDEGFTEGDRKIYERELLRLEMSLKAAPAEGEKLGFLHFPPAGSPQKFSGFMQLFEDYGVRNVYYGHVHGEEGFKGAIRGDYHGIIYSLISADYLSCRLLQIK
ncbi:MAG: metallophosphoesterase [Lentihominibacter sp.]